MSNSSLADSATNIKRCTRCNVDKSRAEFHKYAHSKDGLCFHCKECDYIAKKAYRVANPGKERASTNAWRLKNLEKALATEKAWRVANSEKQKQHAKAWRLANIEKDKENKKTWRAENPDMAKAIAENWYMMNREHVLATSKTWSDSNRDKKRVHGHCRRARNHNAHGTHTASQITALLTLQRFRCVYCKGDIKKKYHIDHIIALAKGGSNDIKNIQLLCPSCNLKKGTADPITFAKLNGLLI